MDLSNYLNRIEERLKGNYEIERNVTLNHFTIDLFAKWERKNEKFFSSKSTKIWGIEKFDYVFIKKVNHLTEKSLVQFQDFLKRAIDLYLKPSSEHMSSTITGVILVNELEENLKPLIRKYKFRRIFALSLKGWADIRLIVVNLETNDIIYNRKGKEIATYYLPEIEGKRKRLFRKKRKDNET